MNAKAVIVIILFFVLLFTYQRKGYIKESLYKHDCLDTSRTTKNIPQKIHDINIKNRFIDSITCDVEIKLQNRFLANVDGEMTYKKNKNFRLMAGSLLGKEIDVGSNDKIFWFWSKRLKPRALYYTTHENTNLSRLRTPFHPIWIKESLGIDSLPTDNISIIESGKFCKIYQNCLNASNEPVVKMTLIDNEKILGHYIYDRVGNLLVRTEVKYFQHINGLNFPKTMITFWAEENISIQWDFNRVKFNSMIDESQWRKPNITPEIDLARQ